MINPWHKELWKEGKYLDLWSLNHVLGGMLIAGIFIFLNIDLKLALILSFLITLSWEIYEVKKGLHEAPTNKVFDLLTNLLGVYLMYAVVALNIIDTNAVFTTVLLCFIILEIWGFLAIQSEI